MEIFKIRRNLSDAGCDESQIEHFLKMSSKKTVRRNIAYYLSTEPRFWKNFIRNSIKSTVWTTWSIPCRKKKKIKRRISHGREN